MAGVGMGVFKEIATGELVYAMQLAFDTEIEQAGLTPERGLAGSWVVMSHGVLGIERQSAFAERYVRAA